MSHVTEDMTSGPKRRYRARSTSLAQSDIRLAMTKIAMAAPTDGPMARADDWGYDCQSYEPASPCRGTQYRATPPGRRANSAGPGPGRSCPKAAEGAHEDRTLRPNLRP